MKEIEEILKRMRLPDGPINFYGAVASLELLLIKKALEANTTHLATARALNIPAMTLYWKMRKYGLKSKGEEKLEHKIKQGWRPKDDVF